MPWRNSYLLETMWLPVEFNDPSAQTSKHKHAYCALKRCHWESGWSSVLPAGEAKQLLQCLQLGTVKQSYKSCHWEPHELCFHGLLTHTVPPDLRGCIMMMTLFLVSPKSIREIIVWSTKGIQDLSLYPFYHFKNFEFQPFWCFKNNPGI